MWKLAAALCFIAPLCWGQPGTIRTVLGAFPLGDGRQAVDATLVSPGAITTDSDGNLYILENCRLRRVTRSGIISTVAGTGVCGYSGDGGPAAAAQINNDVFSGIAISPQGDIFVSDTNNGAIRRISRGSVSTWVDPPSPTGLAFDSGGNLYFADARLHSVYRITPLGAIERIAGLEGAAGFNGDGGPAVQARLNLPYGITVDRAGFVYIADAANNRVRRVSPDGGMQTVAGGGQNNSATGTATAASLRFPTAVSVDSQGGFYIAESDAYRVRYVDASRTISVAAGTGDLGLSGDGGPAAAARLRLPIGLALADDGSLLISDAGSQRVRRVGPSRTISVVAGVDPQSGEGGAAVYARLSLPQAVATDARGNLYVAEFGLGAVRVMEPSGSLRLFAGHPDAPSFQNGQQARAARLTFPSALAAAESGEIYIADSTRVYRVQTNGVISAIAGQNLAGSTGDGALAIDARLNQPTALAINRQGELFIADASNHRIRRIDSRGIITTYAGTGQQGFRGDGGPSTAALFHSPYGIALGPLGDLFVADNGNHRIRRISPQGVITTVLSGTERGLCESGSRFCFPRQIVVSAAGDLFFTADNRVLKFTASGALSVIAGSMQPGFTGDGGPALSARMAAPFGIALDPSGNLFIADRLNNRIRKIQSAAPLAVSPTGMLFSFALEANPASQLLAVTSATASPRRFTIASTEPWLSISVPSGIATEAARNIAVTANPTGLRSGAYSAELILQDDETTDRLSIPVRMTVASTPLQLYLPEGSLTFSAAAGGVSPPAQTLHVANRGSGKLSFTASAETVSGGDWLTVTPSSGTSDALSDPSALSVRVDPSSLSPGLYSGLIQVSAPGVDNSPQTAGILLRVAEPSEAVDPVLSTGALVFVPGSSAAELLVSNPGTTSRSFSVRADCGGAEAWCTISANDGIVTAGETLNLSVNVDSSKLEEGVHRGAITLLFQPGDRVFIVDLLLVNVTRDDALSAQAKDRSRSACAPSRLVPKFTEPVKVFTLRASWPATVRVKVFDNCGNPMVKGNVLVSGAGADPESLSHTSGGEWAGTVKAQQIEGTSIRLTVSAVNQDLLEGTDQIAGNVRPDNDYPVVFGTSATLGVQPTGIPLGVGGALRIRGSRLADESRESSEVPLPSRLGTVSAIIGPYPLLLSAISDHEIRSVIPFEAAANGPQRLFVRRGNLLSAGVEVLLVPAQPVIFTESEEPSTQGQVFVETPNGRVLADEVRPAKSGETVALLATGLGAVTPTQRSGFPGPDQPRPQVMTDVAVTIQGQPATVISATLAPSLFGVYVITATVPPGISDEVNTPVVLRAGQQFSPPVTIAVGERKN